MRNNSVLTHEFVEYIPDTLDDGRLYVSIRFATVAHKCCCGCGIEVVTPLSPTDWKLTFDGKSISLYPSVGNWGLDCQSHYWITSNRVRWARTWSQAEIDAGRANDRSVRESYDEDSAEPVDASLANHRSSVTPEQTIRERLMRWWKGLRS